MTIVLTVLCIIAFVCGAIVYRAGFIDGQRAGEGRRIRSMIPKKRKMSEAEEKVMKGIENLLDYAQRKYKKEGNL